MHIYTLSSCLLNRKLKLESELAAQLWRVSWDDVQMSNLDKVLRRACSRLTMSLVTQLLLYYKYIIRTHWKHIIPNTVPAFTS